MVVWEPTAARRSAWGDGGVWQCWGLHMGRAEERNEREEAVADLVVHSEVQESVR